jgi:site-specific recombinase
MTFIKFFQRKKEIIGKSLSIKLLFDDYIAGFAKLQKEVDVEFLVDIVNVFRPEDIKTVEKIDLFPLIELLSENESYRLFFSSYVKELLANKDLDNIITDSGIIEDTNFFYEVKKRIGEKILPSQSAKNTLQFILNQVFYSNTDPIWLKTIPKEQIEQLFDYCGFNSIYREGKDNFILSELLYGLGVLVSRILGKAMETDVNKMVPEFQNFDSPFISIQKEISDLNERLMDSPKKFINSDDLSYRQILLLHKQCENYIETAFSNSQKYGISLKVNQSLLRIKQQLERIRELIPFLVLDSDKDAVSQTIDFSFKLIRYNCKKSNVKKLINESTHLLSYEITQHTAQTGEHYITRTRKEYFKMFRTACGGGLIVAFLCVFKLLLGKIDASDFGHAFLYSMNYSIGFIAIYLFGCTLATKQPAMTASALISALEKGVKDKNKNNANKYHNFAVFFARVFRSQFIAFVGNVIFSFPVALFLIWGIDNLFHYNIAEKKWFTLINDLSPLSSPAVFHAAIAGFFLFISGIIAGSIANRDKYKSIYYRIQEHPTLKRTFGKEKTLRIANFYEKKWAGIISNFWFGVFMGSTMSIGVFIGLDLDIRHITFASGNLALGLYGSDFHVSNDLIFWGVFGIGIIGLINFLVSFTLSLTLAFRSRDIPFLELRLVAVAVWRFFKQKPLEFFFPPNSKKLNQTIQE